MKKRYIFPALLVIAVVFDLWLYLPGEKHKSSLLTDSFPNVVNSANIYLTTDIVAKKIINGDPVIFLVDVRSQEEYDGYSLPGAVNIPLKDLPRDDWRAYLNTKGRDIIFYSNADIRSKKARSFCERHGSGNFYVLEGGLNNWFETIIKPKNPDETASTSEIDQVSFRTGASIYFGSEITAAAADAKTKKLRKK